MSKFILAVCASVPGVNSVFACANVRMQACLFGCACAVCARVSFFVFVRVSVCMCVCVLCVMSLLCCDYVIYVECIMCACEFACVRV